MNFLKDWQINQTIIKYIIWVSCQIPYLYRAQFELLISLTLYLYNLWILRSVYCVYEIGFKFGIVPKGSWIWKSVIKFKSKGLIMGRTGLKITPKEPLIFFENVTSETKGFPQKKGRTTQHLFKVQTSNSIRIWNNPWGS